MGKGKWGTRYHYHDNWNSYQRYLQGAEKFDTSKAATSILGTALKNVGNPRHMGIDGYNSISCPGQNWIESWETKLIRRKRDEGTSGTTMFAIFQTDMRNRHVRFQIVLDALRETRD
jgi:hypothetical protein